MDKEDKRHPLHKIPVLCLVSEGIHPSPGRTFYYAEIVNGKTAVQIAGDFFNLAAHFIDLLVVGDTGINVK